MTGLADIGVNALGFSLFSGALAYMAARIIAPQASPRPDRVWTAACLLTLAPLLLAAPLVWLSRSGASGFDPAWFEGLAGALPGLDAPKAGMDMARAAGGAGLVSILIILWLAGAGARLAFEIGRNVRLSRLMRVCAPASPALETLAAALSARTGVSRPPVVKIAPAGTPPFTAGAAAPVIVIARPWLAPERAGALRCILIHELCHVRRGDARTDLVFRAASILLWFNPFWFSIQRRRRVAVETACDAAALDVIETGGARLYARTLLEAARACSGRPMAVGFGVADKRIMEMRLRSILTHTPETRRRGAGLASAALLLALAAPAALAQAAQTAAAKDVAFSHAVLAGRVTSRFGPSDVAIRPQKFHDGYDIAAAKGADVAAPADGVVRYAGTGLNGQASYGQVLVLDHGGGWSTLYAHLGGFAVKEGDRVTAGEPIAAVGSSGVSSGPHLHVEVRKDGEPVDPSLYLPGLTQS